MLMEAGYVEVCHNIRLRCSNTFGAESGPVLDMQNEWKGLNYEKEISMTVILYHSLAAKLVGTNVISRARFQFPVHRV
jgi:hypothetical protein